MRWWDNWHSTMKGCHISRNKWMNMERMADMRQGCKPIMMASSRDSRDGELHSKRHLNYLGLMKATTLRQVIQMFIS